MATVYLLTNKSNGKSYVGVSEKTTADRWKKHIAASRTRPDRRTVVQHAIAKHGPDAFEVKTLLVGDVKYCYEMELKIIAALGTQSRGYNRHQGGVGGFSDHPESLEKARASWQSDEYRAAKRRQALELAKDPEYIRRVSEGVRRAQSNPKYKEKHKAAVRNAQAKPEYREMQREIQLVAQNRPGVNERRSESLKAALNSEEGKRICSERAINIHKNEAAHNKIITALQKGLRESWSDPVKKAIRVAKMRATRAAKMALLSSVAIVNTACVPDMFVKERVIEIPTPVSCITWTPDRVASRFQNMDGNEPLYEQIKGLLIDRENDQHFIEGQQSVIEGCR